MQYQKVKALNFLNRNQEGASFFGLFEADDDKIYQVKFDQATLKSNTKEFIANYIAIIVGVPTPLPIMIYIPEIMIKALNIRYNQNLSASKTNYYFALEWEEHVNDSWINFDEFKTELSKIVNYKEFLTIYPFDQFFRNYDRHLRNHLISVKNNKSHFYLAIDADRIFAGEWIERISLEIDKFDCFPYQFHEELYSLVTDVEYKILLQHAAKYLTINSTQVEYLEQHLCNNFAIPDDNIDTITQFILYRKKNILDKCIGNSSCFPRIKYQSLKGGV